MEQLSEITKQEITKLIEIALKPVSGKVKSFGDPFQMAHFSKTIGQPDRNWNETLWAILLDSNYGELTLTISSLHMPDPWDMVEVPIRTDFFLFRNKIPDDGLREINKILYSKEFLALRQKK